MCELLEYLHIRIRDLLASVTIKPDDERVTLEQRQWQNLIDLQARLAAYLRAVGQPHDDELAATPLSQDSAVRRANNAAACALSCSERRVRDGWTAVLARLLFDALLGGAAKPMSYALLLSSHWCRAMRRTARPHRPHRQQRTPARRYVDIPALVDRPSAATWCGAGIGPSRSSPTAVEANPTVGYYWWRLAHVPAVGRAQRGRRSSYTRAHELGVFQWRPLRMAYHGEAAWGVGGRARPSWANAKRRLRWTRISLAEGLRDIRRFREKHFKALAEDDEFRKLVWADDAKDLSRDEGFRHDLRFFMHEAKRIHYDPFRCDQRGRDRLAGGRLDADIPTLSDEQILVRMMAIMRRFGDGHTQMAPHGKPDWLRRAVCAVSRGAVHRGGRPPSTPTWSGPKSCEDRRSVG